MPESYYLILWAMMGTVTSFLLADRLEADETKATSHILTCLFAWPLVLLFICLITVHDGLSALHTLWIRYRYGKTSILDKFKGDRQ
jgi:hypothetical protein